jgi:parallel beta-helix repeat protein
MLSGKEKKGGRKEGAWLALIIIIICIFLVRSLENSNRRSEENKALVPSVDEMLSDNKASVNESRNTGSLDWAMISERMQAIPKFWDFSFVRGGLTRANKTIRVPQEADAIQKAIDQAKSGDTVFVSAGEYKENIFMKDGVSVVGESAAQVVVNGDRKGNVVTFTGINDKSTRLENLTIRNAGESLSGIVIEDSSPIINRNLIRQSDYGVYVKGESSPVIQRNAISESKVGVQIFNLSEPRAASAVILDNIIFSNKKGINIYKSGAVVTHNTISYNGYGGDGSATFGVYLSSASAEIENNIITDNGDCELCSGIYADEGAHDVRIDYNDLWNNPSNFVCFGKCDMGQHNLADEPGFVNGIQYDFTLHGDSPLLGAASDSGKLGARL